MKSNKKILGVILCGGKSSRMGTDKGLMNIAGETLAALIYQKLNTLNIPVVVSVNPDQEKFYKAVFGKEMLCKDRYEIPGPLNGLLSVHEQFPGYDLFVVACDLIDIKEEVLKFLYDTYRASFCHGQNYSYFNEGYFEAVCSIYSAETLSLVKKSWQEGKIQSFSLQNILQQSDTCPVSIPLFFHYCFENYNYKEQVLKREKGI